MCLTRALRGRLRRSKSFRTICRAWRHGAQTRFAQTWAPLRPPRAAVLGELYGAMKVNVKVTGNGNGKYNYDAVARVSEAHPGFIGSLAAMPPGAACGLARATR